MHAISYCVKRSTAHKGPLMAAYCNLQIIGRSSYNHIIRWIISLDRVLSIFIQLVRIVHVAMTMWRI